MRLTFVGKLLVVAFVATIVMSIVAPKIGLACAIVLALIGAFVLAEGFGAGGAEAHEEFARIDADRKREALTGRRR